jgi:uncharacterized membrane protein YccC
LAGRRAADLGRLPIAVDLRALSFEEGVRAGLAVAVLVAANEVLHAPILLEAGLGALLTCLCDAGGLIRRRVPALLLFAAVGGALIAGLGLLRPIGYPLIPLACLGIFLFSLARVYGQSGQQLGNLLSVVLVLALDRSFHAPRPALLLAAAFAGGALWALVLTMAIWRLHPNRPARQAVARVYLALAALCEDLGGLLDADGAAGPEVWERHARGHRRAVREAIELARTMVSERLRAGGLHARPAAQSLIRLETAEQMFVALIGLTDLLEGEPHALVRAEAGELAGRMAGVLRAFGPHIVADSDAGLAAIGAAIAGVAGFARALPADGPLRRIAELLAERLRATMNLTESSDALPGLPPPGRRMDAVLAPLRANFTWESAALRHAARAAAVAAAGLAITFTWPTRYQHWLTITLILTLQPYYAMTLQRALERIGGTVAGGLIAALLGLVCHTPVAITAAIFPLAVLALSLRAVNFGLYMAMLTPLVVLLVELGAPAHGQFAVAGWRALYTVIGGALAVLGCIFLWPSWEPDRLDAELRAAVRSHGRYAELELCLLEGVASAAEVDAARRAAGVASNNLEASLSRALLEPGRRGRDRLEAAMVVDAALRRVAGRISAMQIDPTLRGGSLLAAWRVWLGEVADALDQSLPSALPPRPEEVPEDPLLEESLSRIARQFEVAAGALRRFGEEGP